MKRYLIAILIFSLHQVVFSNQLDFVGVGEKNKSYNLEFSLEKTALIVAQSSSSPFSISLEFKETTLKEDFDLKQNYPIKNIKSSSSENNSIIEIFFYEPSHGKSRNKSKQKMALKSYYPLITIKRLKR
tara:strand:+ start:93 stop:479 length:387 start_codon:yes stop_codon:yes gene_type:complete